MWRVFSAVSLLLQIVRIWAEAITNPNSSPGIVVDVIELSVLASVASEQPGKWWAALLISLLYFLPSAIVTVIPTAKFKNKRIQKYSNLFWKKKTIQILKFCGCGVGLALVIYEMVEKKAADYLASILTVSALFVISSLFLLSTPTEKSTSQLAQWKPYKKKTVAETMM